VEVTYEEFTEDVEENRLIKAATKLLLQTKTLSPKQRLALKSIDSKLDGVTLVQYDKKHLPEIQYTPLNEHYRGAIEMAKFVLKNFGFDLKHGSIESPTFLLYMPKVFEDFVVKALRETKALQSIGANEKNFPQNKPLKFDRQVQMRLSLSLFCVLILSFFLNSCFLCKKRETFM
jgi:5-methylcytosine-specific restriction endonuclease McrBC regulatory subunit McrC